MIGTVLLVVMLLALLFYFYARARQERRPAQDSQTAREQRTDEFLPADHFRYYPQVRQALSQADWEYLAKRATQASRRRWKATRRRVVRGFLAGLKEDYVRLEKLGRTVASLSPELNQELERERLWLGLRFRACHIVLWAAPLGSRWTLQLLDRTAAALGRMAEKTSTAMDALSELDSSAR